MEFESVDENFLKEVGEKRLISHLKENQINTFQRVINVDSLLIDTFFSSANGLTSQTAEELKYEDSKKVDEINYIINNMIPDIEKQVIYLLFFLKKNQETVGRLLDISQEMVCYYKKRALSRIKIHYFFRSIDLEAMDRFLEEHVTRKQRTAMMEYFKGHDLRKIAKKISVDENRKRQIHYEAIGSRIKLGLKKLTSLKNDKNEEIKKHAQLYFEVFSALKRHNSLHHTQSKKKIDKEIIA